MKKLSPVLVALFFSHFLYAQNLTGIWRGYFITESFQQYKFELQLEHKGNQISGVSYSYLTTVFYGKATLTGHYNKETNTAVVREIKTVELRMSAGSSACIMTCTFDYITSGKEEFLEGTFTSVHEKNAYGVKAGDDCGGGTVYLRRVTTSDFYIEPFLRDNVKTRTIPTQPAAPKTSQSPSGTTPVKRSPVTNKQVNPSKTPDNNKTTITTPRIDTALKSEPLPKKQEDIKPQNPKVSVKIPDVLNNRTNELVKTLIITDPAVTLKIYDNGEIDDDTVSVYVDKKLVLSRQRLTHSPLILKLKMDEDNSEHEVVMVAENLGRIPPNTSLMIVEAGDKRYDVRITSTEQKNAVIRFVYKKPD